MIEALILYIVEVLFYGSIVALVGLISTGLLIAASVKYFVKKA